MLKHSKYLLSAAMLYCIGLIPDIAQAQAIEVISGTMGITTGGTKSSVGDSLILGPGTYQINGTWEIYSKSIWISPDAIITGSGQISLYNPSVAGHPASPTYIDGNNLAGAINVSVAIFNNQNLILTDIHAPTGSGWIDNVGNADLSIGGNLIFSVADGDVLLANANLNMSTTASFLWNSITNSDAYVVTNGTGNLVKSGIAPSDIFIFPVGQAEADYTPATITNNAALRNISIQVKTFANSGAVVSTPAEGMDRTWQITSNVAGDAIICLSHNTMTNAAGAGSDGAGFDNTSAFVTQQTGSGIWSTGSQTNGGTPVSSHCATYGLTISASDPTSYFTKVSDPITPLPVTLIDFSIREKECTAILEWSTASENNLSHFDIEYSENGKDFFLAGSVNSRNRPASYIYEWKQSLTKVFYRLKMYDSDGKALTSPTLSLNINCGQDNGITVYPNPATEYVKVKASNTITMVRLYDQYGRIMLSKSSENNEETIDMSPYAAGLYNLVITDASNKQSGFKIIRRK